MSGNAFRRTTRILSASLLLVVLVSAGPAFAGSETVETARLLAILLDAGRVTIAENQGLLNDPGKGEKGFTPDVFKKQALAIFHARAKLERVAGDHLARVKVPALAKRLLPHLMDAMTSTVADYQPVINRPDMGFKGFMPTIFGVQAAAKFRDRTGVTMKQTRYPPRNPRNAPDEIELKALAKFADPSYPRLGEAILSAPVDGGRAVRVMLPLFYGKDCLWCHGAPKGEKDITGYMKEGAKEGDLGGAISVQLIVP